MQRCLPAETSSQRTWQLSSARSTGPEGTEGIRQLPMPIAGQQHRQSRYTWPAADSTDLEWGGHHTLKSRNSKKKQLRQRLKVLQLIVDLVALPTIWHNSSNVATLVEHEYANDTTATANLLTLGSSLGPEAMQGNVQVLLLAAAEVRRQTTWGLKHICCLVGKAWWLSVARSAIGHRGCRCGHSMCRNRYTSHHGQQQLLLIRRMVLFVPSPIHQQMPVQPVHQTPTSTAFQSNIAFTKPLKATRLARTRPKRRADPPHKSRWLPGLGKLRR